MPEAFCGLAQATYLGPASAGLLPFDLTPHEAQQISLPGPEAQLLVEPPRAGANGVIVLVADLVGVQREAVDPDLIGGLVLRVGDTVYDGSVANRLSRLRDDLSASATEKIRGELDRFAVVE